MLCWMLTSSTLHPQVIENTIHTSKWTSAVPIKGVAKGSSFATCVIHSDVADHLPSWPACIGRHPPRCPSSSEPLLIASGAVKAAIAWVRRFKRVSRSCLDFSSFFSPLPRRSC